MMSAANRTLKEECGNGESFDHLSVPLERGEERLVFVFSAVPGGSVLALAREAAFRGHPHGKPGALRLLISKGF